MLFFYNPGLIDIEAVRTMGVSVKRPGSFGMFGTGLKYAIASILRGGGEISLFRGADSHGFSLQQTTIRDEPFDLVCLDGSPMGFTTALGKNWKPWMVLRELGCNARDEGGDFSSHEEGRSLADFQSVDQTVFVVDWADLDDAFRQKGDLFLEGEPIYADSTIRILPGPSRHLFYRGVRVFELEKPAAYSYDILAEQALTEDRTLYGAWGADIIIRDALLKMDDKTTLEAAVCAGSNYHEDGLNFEDAARFNTPSRAFLDTVIQARESRAPGLNESAKRVLMKHIRSTAETEFYGGGTYRRVQSDAFAYAVEVLADLGINFDESVEFVTVPELPHGCMSMVEGGRIYVLSELLHHSTARVIALELLKRHVDLSGMSTADEVVEALGGLLINQHHSLKRDEKLIEEDATVEQQADANAALAPEPEPVA